MHFISQGLEKPHPRNCFLRNTCLFSLREVCQGTWTDNWCGIISIIKKLSKNSYPKPIRWYSFAVKRFEVFMILEHGRVDVDLVPQVLQHHWGREGGEAEADEAEEKTEAERPHREDVGWVSVGPGVRRRIITLERGVGTLYDEPWSRQFVVTWLLYLISLDPLFTVTLNSWYEELHGSH